MINRVLPIASLDDKGRVSRLETTDRIRAPVEVRMVDPVAQEKIKRQPSPRIRQSRSA